MGKKLEYTPRSRIRAALRRLFLRSREHAQCQKNSKYTCEKCGKKKSTAAGKKVDVRVHHRDGIGNWEQIIDAIYEQLLCHPSKLVCLCKECHDKEHE